MAIKKDNCLYVSKDLPYSLRTYPRTYALASFLCIILFIKVTNDATTGQIIYKLCNIEQRPIENGPQMLSDSCCVKARKID